MKKLFLITIAGLVLGGCNPKDLFVKPVAGLNINTSPPSTVFLNDANMGETPFSDEKIKPGSYTLRLVPGDSENLSPYETKIILSPKTQTIISRNFMSTELDSSGHTLQLQEEPSGNTYLSIISDPDNVNIMVDNKPVGFTPRAKVETNPGTYLIKATSPGYVEQELSVKVVKGYNLIVNFKLASKTITLSPVEPATDSATLVPPTPIATESPGLTLTPTDPPRPYVIVGETGTGWLRVRADSAGDSAELGKADTGEKLKYLGESTDLGWHKIEFENQVGWVSGRYVTLVK